MNKSVTRKMPRASKKQAKSLGDIIDSSVDILNKWMAFQQPSVSTGDAPLNLLDLCERLVAEPPGIPAPLRLMHGFAGSGVETFAALLSLVPNLRLLAGSSLITENWLFPDDILWKQDSALLVEPALCASLLAIHAECESRRLTLVSHIEYRDVGAVSPDTSRGRVDFRNFDHDVIGVILARHPVLSYLESKSQGLFSSSPLSLESYAERYFSFLDDYPSCKVVKEEDVLDSPLQILERLVSDLSIPVSPELLGQLRTEDFVARLSLQQRERSQLRYGDGSPPTIQPLDTSAYVRLCERLGYDPTAVAGAVGDGPAPRMAHSASRRTLPARHADRANSRFSEFFQSIARITAPASASSGEQGSALPDMAELIEMVEACLGHRDGFYEALDDCVDRLSPRGAAMLLVACAAHYAAGNDNLIAGSLLAEAGELMAIEDRPMRLLAAEIYLKLGQPRLAVSLLTADAFQGSFALSQERQAQLSKTLEVSVPQKDSEHGHSLLIEALTRRPPKPIGRKRVLIEIGTTRERVPGQGSTEKLATVCAELGIDFITVDMDRRNSAMARRMFLRRNFPFRSVTAKGEDFLLDWDGPIDYCFLDAYDFDHGMHSELRQSRYEAFLGEPINDTQCHKMHLDCAQTLAVKLAPDGLICFDDTWTAEDGRWLAKGTTAMPFLLENGFKVIEARNKAALLVRAN